jgi:death-on-curing protein
VSEPAFLTLAEVLEIHKDQIERYGGTHGIRDIGLVESALAMPRAGFGGEYLHESLLEMAAAYAYHIAENQPFLDGNKRAGLAAALVFLDINGIVIDDPKGRLYDAMIKIGARKLDKRGLAEVLSGLAEG